VSFASSCGNEALIDLRRLRFVAAYGARDEGPHPGVAEADQARRKSMDSGVPVRKPISPEADTNTAGAQGPGSDLHETVDGERN
jgi:hypothetical protein